MIEWFKETWQGLVDWVNSIVDGIIRFFEELPLNIFEMFLDSILNSVKLLQPPAFIKDGMQSILSQMHPDVIYFMANFGFATALSVIGTGAVIRLTRSFMPVGLW